MKKLEPKWLCFGRMDGMDGMDGMMGVVDDGRCLMTMDAG